MRLVTSTFLFPFTLMLSAQTLDQSVFAPTPGQSFTVHQTPFIPIPSGGAGVTWDYSGMTTAATATVEYVDIVGSGLEPFLPASQYLQNNVGSDVYGPMHVDATGWYLDGQFDNAQTLLLSYNSSYRFLSFPCSHQSTWQGNYAGDWFFNFSTNLGLRSGSFDGEADGFGTVLMPFGPVDNVLRVKLDFTYADATIVGNQSSTGVLYQYFKPGVAFPLIAHGTEAFTNTGGVTTSIDILRWLGDQTVGTSGLSVKAIGMEAFPNPASGSTTVVFGAQGTVDLTLVDMAGRTLRQLQRPGLAAGIHQQVVDLAGLPAGLYVLNVVAANGDRGSLRVQVL